MKTILLISIIILLGIKCFGQISFDQIMASYDESKVPKIEVMGHKFSVGDTLTFANGSFPNGDFLCTSIISESSQLSYIPLSAAYVNHKFVISKIYKITGDYNLVLDLDKKNKIFVFVDPVIALTKKEIK